MDSGIQGETYPRGAQRPLIVAREEGEAQMDEKEMREKLAALEAQNASLEEQEALREKIVALEAETESDADAAADAAKAGEGTAVTTAGAAAGQTAVTQAVPAADVAEPATNLVVVRKSGRFRSFLIAVLIVLSCLAVVVSGVTIWAHYTVLNTDGYMKVVGPIGKDPAAIKSLSDYVASQVITATDLQARTQAALPTQAQFLAAPITDAVNSFITKQTNKVLSTPQAYDVWLKVNEVAHEKIVGLLRGDNTNTYIAGSDVKLNTIPLISQALVWIDGKLPGALSSRFSPPVIAPGTPPDQAIQQVSQWSGKTLPADFGQVTLLTNSSLGPAQTAVRIFDALVIVLPIVTALLIAVTIWLSRRRRHTIIALGIGAAIALIITHVIVNRVSTAVVDKLKLGDVTTVVRDVVSASLRPLTTLTIWIVVIGVVVAVIAWIVGRRDVQVAVVKAGKSVVSKADEGAAADSAVTRWIGAHATLLRLAGIIVDLLLLLLLGSSWWVIILLLVLLVVYEGAISLVAKEWPFGPGAEDTAGGETVG